MNCETPWELQEMREENPWDPDSKNEATNLEGFHEQTREANDCLFGLLIKIRKLRQKLLCQLQLLRETDIT